MARKNLLDGLMQADAGPRPAPRAGGGAQAPRMETKSMTGRAIGAVGQSIADLRARAIEEIPTGLIDAGGIRDRIGHDPEDHARLVASIREHGQQVPVLVRPHADKPGRYQIVYGRRRARALAELGLPVKALIREMDDEALVIAQGQENSARRDLSFIEKASFARQMTKAGYKRKVIADALSIDKTAISRMLSIIEHLPIAAMLAIGPAHPVGRDRWARLATLIAETGADTGDIVLLAEHANEAAAKAGTAHGPTGLAPSEARFEAVLEGLTARQKAAEAENRRPAEQPPAPHTPTTEVRRQGDSVVVRLTHADTGFAEWLAGELPRLHAGWKAGR